eukprot:Pgem_evm1s3206
MDCPSTHYCDKSQWYYWSGSLGKCYCEQTSESDCEIIYSWDEDMFGMRDYRLNFKGYDNGECVIINVPISQLEKNGDGAVIINPPLKYCSDSNAQQKDDIEFAMNSSFLKENDYELKTNEKAISFSECEESICNDDDKEIETRLLQNLLLDISEENKTIEKEKENFNLGIKNKMLSILASPF